MQFLSRHFLSVADFSRKELGDLIERGLELKRHPAAAADALRGRTLALLFMKHSTRTRVSFEVAMHQTGGSAIYLSSDTTQLGRGETVADTARTLSRYVDGIAARLFGHDELLELAEHATVPVINGLTDFNHPCQALADLMTIQENMGRLADVRVVFIGAADDNVVNSLLHVCPQFGTHLTVCSPQGQSLNPTAYATGRELAEKTGAEIRIEHNPTQAVRDADVVYTDVWFSMHEEPSEEGLETYRPYQVNAALMSHAPAHALFMHCMPVHRGWEATDDIADSSRSLIFEQAENRLHVQKAILLDLMARAA